MAQSNQDARRDDTESQMGLARQLAYSDAVDRVPEFLRSPLMGGMSAAFVISLILALVGILETQIGMWIALLTFGAGWLVARYVGRGWIDAETERLLVERREHYLAQIADWDRSP